ncbi:SH3 type 3 domain protein [Calothrix sp. NIES-2100]|uniref:SH3 domain-containing protein n=1 Tax=Calothrix sp. NIES-2100 TaxID=1954172 RepID=UPI000B60AAAE|nr:SH3 type 3 domain protein [Calothrix sp. NIES-2100]
MKYQKTFSILVAIALLFSICSIVPEGALAQPAFGIAIRTNKPKGCVEDGELKKEPLEFYIIHDPENPSSNSPASINIREKPSTTSAVVHVASSGNPVIIFQQVVIDNYCWLKVDVTSVSKNDPTSYITVRGWVRGDFVIPSQNI